MTKPECKDCRFWCEQEDPDADTSVGECRRYPPTIPWREASDQVCPYDPNEFPLIHEDDWCGEFKPRDVAGVGGSVDFDRLAPWSDFENGISTRVRNMLYDMGIHGWESLHAAFTRQAGEGFDPTIKAQVAGVAMRQRNIGKVQSQHFIDHLGKAGWPFRD